MIRAKVVVTGGSGFLGKALAAKLASEGYEVHSVARSDVPEFKSIGVQHLRIDLTAPGPDLRRALDGAETVYHTAAKVDMWGRYQDFFAANVEATRNLLDLSRGCGVRKFVFTSSPSVVADGSDLCGVDESYPYPKRYSAHYPATKAQAEREVLAANDPGQIKTVALRPHLIFGPGDTNLVPTVLERAKAGRLLRIGDGSNLTDLTFIEDCVNAHILADTALDNNPDAAGKAYFISQGEPVKLWSWVDEVLTLHALPRIRRHMPYKLASGLAAALEVISRIRPGYPEPLLTKFLVCEMATSHYFNIQAAKRDLGFVPKYSIAEAMKRTFASQPRSIAVND
ncbi:MAG: NAD-dependent epimerase/dehydratase family protein [Deltaproteobacteria bacterium]|nr:NAD-dependent epimerase/dehydratase family protein [Deltaproteobacteria bacterium]